MSFSIVGFLRAMFNAFPTISLTFLSYVGIFVSEFMAMNTVSFSRVKSRQRVSAQRIFTGCYDFHVGRVDTMTNSAEMVNLHSFWNWPIYLFVGNTVCLSASIFSVDLITESTVSTMIKWANPKPARICFIDLTPKTYLKWNWLGSAWFSICASICKQSNAVFSVVISEILFLFFSHRHDLLSHIWLFRSTIKSKEVAF